MEEASSIEAGGDCAGEGRAAAVEGDCFCRWMTWGTAVESFGAWVVLAKAAGEAAARGRRPAWWTGTLGIIDLRGLFG